MILTSNGITFMEGTGMDILVDLENIVGDIYLSMMEKNVSHEEALEVISRAVVVACTEEVKMIAEEEEDGN